ncbi:helix-turn-helix domain-containing protein [Secundilactobacillus kimchicus]|uniref:helix-turn-helix domain-containing protein n=1 Tax=Secundilactobacillus kimchicus TaxID=528209 RepID=UPI001C024E40|nr:helix-turn-helix transcriptional regulator [Secundilactobacillus kimchicus]MBT9670424.1 helix-turn-helix domain-containing protein [Secundilactobacillus kimchicus]
MTVFERIKKIADQRGLNLKEVAKRSGMKSETAIYRYNQGVTPRKSTLIAIAKVLDVSVDYLLGKTDNPATKSEKHTVDIADDDNADILRFEGRPIPPDDLEVMKRFLRGGKGE